MVLYKATIAYRCYYTLESKRVFHKAGVSSFGFIDLKYPIIDTLN